MKHSTINPKNIFNHTHTIIYSIIYFQIINLSHNSLNMHITKSNTNKRNNRFQFQYTKHIEKNKSQYKSAKNNSTKNLKRIKTIFYSSNVSALKSIYCTMQFIITIFRYSETCQIVL